MTDEVLNKANKLKSRLKEIDSLIKQIEVTNTATGEERISPICIQAGINSPVEFYVGGDLLADPLYDLNNTMYDQVLNLLKAYKTEVQRVFDNLHD